MARESYEMLADAVIDYNDSLKREIQAQAANPTDFMLNVADIVLNDVNVHAFMENLKSLILDCFPGRVLQSLHIGVPDNVGAKCMQRAANNDFNILTVRCSAQNFNTIYDDLELSQMKSYGYDHQNNPYLDFFVCRDV